MAGAEEERSKPSTVGEFLQVLKEELDKRFPEARAKFDEVLGTAKKVIEGRPLLALAAASTIALIWGRSESPKQGLGVRMSEESRRSLLDRIVGALLDTIKEGALRSIDRYVREARRLLLLLFVGVAFVAAGLILVIVGIVTYLSQLIPSWLAWGTVGLVAILIGALSLMRARLRR